MIDFKKASYLKLKPVNNQVGVDMIAPMLVDEENVFAMFKTVRDMVVFTNKRIVSLNVQGIKVQRKILPLYLTVK